jgi:hypothetical protein
MSDTLVDLDDGYIVVRDLESDHWVISWYPYDEHHPDYPCRTLRVAHTDGPEGGFEAVIEWAFERYARAALSHA